MNIKKNFGAIVSAGVLALLFAGNASAVPISFDYSGSCLTNCGVLGLATNGAVGGFLDTDSAVLASSRVESSDVGGFAFSFGTFSFNSATAEIETANLIINAAGDGFASGRIFIRDLSTNTLLVAFEFLDSWLFTDFMGIARGTGSFSLRAPQVPEPATPALFALGLLAAAGFARRRRG